MEPLGVRVGQADEVIDITRVESFERPPHDVHALPRHRLFPQAHGFEGLVCVAVGPVAPDFAVAESDDVDRAQFGLNAGPLASTQDPDEDEDGVPQVTELLRLDVELLPLSGETLYVALDRSDAAKRFPAEIRKVRPPLDIGMPEFCDGVERHRGRFAVSTDRTSS
jgi:hypothetical protein